MILGIDEVGRGPWAGPLVVGAVVLGGATIAGLDDSKKLTKKRREVLSAIMYEQAAAVALGWVSAAELDEIGMSEALRLATKRAVEQIHVPYHEIIIDGTVNFLEGTTKGNYVTTMPKADALVPSVSAASIVAKVARDQYMAEQDEAYPGYGFKGHAGYGVAKHREAIERLGVTPLHRLSFAPLQKYALAEGAGAMRPSRHAVSRRDVSNLFSRVSAGLIHSSKPEKSSDTPGLPGIHGSPIAAAPTSRQTGSMGENAACVYLQSCGYQIIERNWRTKWCEIDIIARKDDTLYFVEVKHRRNDKAGDGLAAITPKKLRQMQFAAELYATKCSGFNLMLAAVSTAGDPPQLVDFLPLT